MSDFFNKWEEVFNQAVAELKEDPDMDYLTTTQLKNFIYDERKINSLGDILFTNSWHYTLSNSSHDGFDKYTASVEDFKNVIKAMYLTPIALDKLCSKLSEFNVKVYKDATITHIEASNINALWNGGKFYLCFSDNGQLPIKLQYSQDFMKNNKLHILLEIGQFMQTKIYLDELTISKLQDLCSEKSRLFYDFDWSF